MKQKHWKWVKRVGGAVVLTLVGTSPAWAVTGLTTDLKDVTSFFSYGPGLLTYGMFAVGTGTGLYAGHMIHKKGEHEAQGRPVTMKNIAYPALASAFLFGFPWITGSAQKTFFNDTTSASATVGTTSHSVKIP